MNLWGFFIIFIFILKRLSMKKFKEWHTSIIKNYMNKFNMGVFELVWLSWFKGVIMAVVLLLLTSCGTTYQLSTLNHNPIYDGNVEVVDVTIINNEFELAKKFRTDDTFRWNFAQYAMSQDMRWSYDFYWNNRMYRSPFASPFDFYWNSNSYWWNWASNSHFNMGFNHWNPFGFNNYGWGSRYYGYGYGWNNGYYGNGWGYRNRMNDYAWNNRNRTNTAYVVGRRSSNNVVVSNRTNVIKDVVIDREIIKLKRGNNNIRIYNNPNNVPNNIRNNRSTPVRNYNRPENNRNSNNNIINNNSRPSRTYSPPSRSSSPVISRPPSRSSNPPVINRSGGSKPVIKR